MGRGLKVGDKVVHVGAPGALGVITELSERGPGLDPDCWVRWPQYDAPVYHWGRRLRPYAEPASTSPERPSAKAKAQSKWALHVVTGACKGMWVRAGGGYGRTGRELFASESEARGAAVQYCCAGETIPYEVEPSSDEAVRELTEVTQAMGGYDKELPTVVPDPVNHPDHYKQGNIECIDAIQAALTPEEFRGYCKGNALKYVWREKHKGQDESVRKAIWYLNRLVTK